MLSSTTIQLLRIPFSYFLMPVFWFALSFAGQIDWAKAVSIFIVLHLLVYPASNGYNSYMDQDETSIGGVENPGKPTRQLFHVSVVLDVLAVVASFFISQVFFAGVVFYILCSRLYSYRGIRLKKYPIAGYLTVILNQGAVVFYIVWASVQPVAAGVVPWLLLTAAAFLIGGFYPITQVYQHEADAKDGVTTISMKLGKRGTFIFCGAMYIVAFSLLYLHFLNHDEVNLFVIMNLLFLPVIAYYLWWMMKVWKQPVQASFKNTMNMNWLASTCTSLAFITILLIRHRG